MLQVLPRDHGVVDVWHSPFQRFFQLKVAVVMPRHRDNSWQACGSAGV